MPISSQTYFCDSIFRIGTQVRLPLVNTPFPLSLFLLCSCLPLSWWQFCSSPWGPSPCPILTLLSLSTPDPQQPRWLCLPNIGTPSDSPRCSPYSVAAIVTFHPGHCLSLLSPILSHLCLKSCSVGPVLCGETWRPATLLSPPAPATLASLPPSLIYSFSLWFVSPATNVIAVTAEIFVWLLFALSLGPRVVNGAARAQLNTGGENCLI